jgi:hypothetical protein
MSIRCTPHRTSDTGRSATSGAPAAAAANTAAIASLSGRSGRSATISTQQFNGVALPLALHPPECLLRQQHLELLDGVKAVIANQAVPPAHHTTISAAGGAHHMQPAAAALWASHQMIVLVA